MSADNRKKWCCKLNWGDAKEVFVFAEDEHEARNVVCLEFLKKDAGLVLDVDWMSRVAGMPVEETPVIGPKYNLK